MGKSPSQFEETIRHQFDRICKLALKGEKIDYIRHMEYLHKNEVMISELSQEELNQLFVQDEYDLESFRFQVLNYDIEVKDSLIAEALTLLTKKKRDVILLSYFMGMSDAEIARKMKLVRSTVNEHRRRSLEILKEVMEEKADESKI
ncbi:sigma-70 family RNA polymerase sigma factor [Lachnospiraceae bacterium AM26-1LB]|jgi:RNA polymerase sigma factor (sigma-70 family)|nr:sigma-70 family RNA polymerase sigma factor [Lachnospiraceae bacterium AM26-1LB]